MKITKNKSDLQFKCNKIDYKTGLKIANDLKKVILYPQHKNCIGLAHNQIKGNKFVFIAKLNNTWKTFINGEIIFYSKEKFKHLEGCMSCPNKENKVKRYKDIILQYHTKNGMIIEKFNGGNAQIIQHAVDHLNGIHIFNKGETNNGK